MLGARLFGLYCRYYYACLYGDVETVKQIMSTKAKSVVESRAKRKKSTSDSTLKEFLEKKKAGFTRIQKARSDQHVLALERFEANEGKLSITVSLGQVLVSKPIRFVFEEGEYKLALFAESNRYNAINQGTESHEIECKGGTRQTLPPNGAEYYMTCEDEDDCGFFDGTWFRAFGKNERMARGQLVTPPGGRPSDGVRS